MLINTNDFDDLVEVEVKLKIIFDFCKAIVHL